MSLSRLTKITGPGVATDTNWVGNNANFTGVTTTGSSFNVGVTTVHSTLIEAHNIKSTGIITATGAHFSGNVSIAGTLTYEDLTNVDSVGLITARDGIFLPDNQKAQFGNAAGSADLNIYHSGSHSFIDDTGTGNLKIRSNNLRISNGDESKIYATFTPTTVELYQDNSKKIETTSTGINVTGNLVSDGLVVDGNSDLNGDLDVDGHTNLDNVSIAGVSTFAGTITAATVNATGGNFSGNLRFANNVGTLFGASDELQVFHNSGTSYISHNGSGQLQIRAKSSEQGIKIFPDGAVELYHNNNRKIFTTSTGVQISCDPDGDGLKFEGTTRRIDLVANTNRSGATNTILELDAHWNNTSVAFIALATGDDTTNKDDGRLRFFTKPSGGSIAERLRIEPDGQVVFGGAGSRNVGFTHRLQIEDTNDTPHGFSMISNRANQYGPHMSFAKSRGSTRGSVNIVQDDDELATLLFRGADGTDISTTAAQIDVRVDGTPGSNNIPGSFEFYTRNASSQLAKRLIINSSGHLMPGADSTYNIGSSSVRFANVYADTLYGDGSNLTGIAADKIFEGNTEVETVDTGSDGHVKITTEGGERVRIDSAGRVLIGRTASRMVGGSTTYAKLQVAGTSQSESSISIVNNENNTNGAFLFIGKTRGGSVGASTIVQNGDSLGGLSFIGADGNDTNNRTAEITAVVNGGPGNNTIPTDLTFSTSTQNATQLTERMRIYSTGRILIGNGASEQGPSGNLDIVGDINGNGGELYLRVSNNNVADNIGALFFGNNVDKSIVKIQGVTHTANNTGDIAFHTSTTGTMSEKVRITNAGQVLPGGDATQDLGTSSKRWRNVYTTDLQLSNVGGGGNEVDGTEGHWTLQEGESHIYMINRKTGKKYEMMLKEVD